MAKTESGVEEGWEGASEKEREDVATPNFNSLITGARATSCRRSNISNYCVRKPLGLGSGKEEALCTVVYTRSCTPVPASRLGPSRTITRTWTLTNTPTILLAFACGLSLSLSLSQSQSLPNVPEIPGSVVESSTVGLRKGGSGRRNWREKERVGIENVLKGLKRGVG